MWEHFSIYFIPTSGQVHLLSTFLKQNPEREGFKIVLTIYS